MSFSEVALTRICRWSDVFVCYLRGSFLIRLIAVQPVFYFHDPETSRSALPLVDDAAVLDYVESFEESSIGSVRFVFHAVHDDLKSLLSCCYDICCPNSIAEISVKVDVVVVLEGPTVGRVRLLDVHHEEVAEGREFAGQTTETVETGHERRSCAASEDDDQGSGTVLEVQQVPLFAFECHNGRIVSWPALLDAFACVQSDCPT